MSKTHRKLFVFFLILSYVLPIRSQVISYTPAFPKVNDTLVLTYNAAQGNGQLSGVSPVYMHTGVITNRSAALSDWKLRPAVWGTSDPKVLMQNMGNNIHTLTFRIDSFYSIPNNVEAINLGFVFRNADGSLVGKNADNSDIFIPLFKLGYDARFTAPLGIPSIISTGTVLPIEVRATENALINVYHNGQLLTQNQGQSLSTQITATQTGKFWLKFTAQSPSGTIVDSTYYIVQPPITIQDPPAGIKNGINYINNTTAVLCLLAPQKNFVYVKGDFTNWELDPAFLMKKSVDGNRYWLEVSGLTPQQEYRFQYSVNAEINVGDPFSEKILDEFNDPGINVIIYPNLIPYPVGKTSEIVSVLQTGKQPYQWVNNNYNRPWKEDLLIYELLVRDFTLRHDFKSITQKLDYLEELGINAIELMPVMEFDGNDSWGYAPAFFTAVDKYYGPADDLKELIDSAHGRGIAIILDIVPNHAFGQFPYVRLYWDDVTNKPATYSPFFNHVPMHPFNVGYDFNHESTFTQQYFDQVFKYWVEEFNIDGYRIDLSKGITQNYTDGDIGAWSQYDQSRINLLKRLANTLWANHPDTWLILEHFANNDEETELANFGFMLWGIGHDTYKEAALGWPQSNSNFAWNVSYQAKGWNDPHAVGFFESHDEERIMFEMINYGNSSGTYNVKQLQTALKRKGLLAAFLYTVPGPKMMWQFGELGYDYSIYWPTGTEVSRTVKKPVRWDYYDDANRRCLFCNYSAILRLRRDNAHIFRTPHYNIDASGMGKRIWVSHNDMNVIVLGNFHVVSITMIPDFQHTGTWYNYLKGTSINVSNTQAPITLAPGEFAIYTNVQLPNPQIDACCNIGSTNNISLNTQQVDVYPNPFTEEVSFDFTTSENTFVNVEIFNLLGHHVKTIRMDNLNPGEHILKWDGSSIEGHKVSTGYYLYKMTSKEFVSTGKISYINTK